MKNLRSNIVYEGDAARIMKNVSRFPSNSINLVLTSPPYGDRRVRNYTSVRPEEYVEWFIPIANEIYRVLNPNGSFVLNIKEGCRGGERETYVLELVLAMKRAGWLWVEEYCWYKKNSFPGKWQNRFRDSWERCFHFTKSTKFKMNQGAVKVPIGDWSKQRFKSLSLRDFERSISGTDSRLGRRVSNWLGKRRVNPHNVLIFETEHYPTPSNIITLSTECKNSGHSAVFPMELPSWFIKLFTSRGDIVLDPFLGSGTTAVASVLLDRRFIGIEVHKSNSELARANIRSAKLLLKDRK
jgi:site-specific DNA-methyltransferase (adenine-specific)/site-specific DNA-methyltransferase (cytosine-N4-specific)